MTLPLDPQIAAATEAVYAAMQRVPRAPVGDWEARRRSLDKMFARLVAGWPAPAGVSVTTVRVPVTRHSSREGAAREVPARLYRPAGSTGGSLVVYAHGGGMFSGTLDAHEPVVRRIAAEAGVPVLSVGYRLAPEHPFPAAIDDVYAALEWAGAERSGEWDPSRLVVMGDSAGGGIAAAVSLMARDVGTVVPAAQVLVYPMLDDRTVSAHPAAEPWLMWTPDDNVTAWRCLLGDAACTGVVSPYAAPARATDLAGLPRAYLDVGQLDLYCDEDVAYARRLAAAGVATELHVFPGAPHAFELFAPGSDVARTAWELRMRFVRSV